ncbi:carboxylating nicotinate-nucleotide diphosphorylase [Thalassotalea sp. G20_0]|uniref:carboxylating nicotinate-nucleotide diphosphorylase n=1 Tax=Thalassotalea sp. G20_0 TaxID=2821093 RepID=UPI001ADB6747|nr:carboxylating nicotinate-nucleotide diphosphorylase [Thalassotalea sp. G20_0]MBO9493197.1 carboxylating nicotinate-nucleotide diphosphorylase [Thalassotalea sp. G20_0]
MKESYTLPENLSPVLRDQLQGAVETNVRKALAEDIGSGDITASLIPRTQQSVARIICRDHAIICGRPWFDEVFRQIDPNLQLEWHIEEGERVEPNQVLVVLKGAARSLLTGERAAMNFLQTLSGTATRCQRYASLVSSTSVKLLDTRKTLPGLRVAQKYAVAAGGCHNHRIGLFDAFLIKENHIAACGGIAQAVGKAHEIAPGKPVEIEVESMEEFNIAREAGADIIMLDNFPLTQLAETVRLNRKLPGKAPKLEASGGINDQTLVPIAETGVDFISIGTLTKDCQSVDLSMRIVEQL